MRKVYYFFVLSLLFLGCNSSDDEEEIIEDPIVNFEFEDVFNPLTGRTWMDRNLGAERVATSSNDSQSYGYLFQWGRLSDGHQLRNSNNTNTLSNSDVPGHNEFIISPNMPRDWREPSNDNLWQGLNGINNPCPDGYRLPTEIEWEQERLSWETNNGEGAFNSPLKLPMAGERRYGNGEFGYIGTRGVYWASTRNENSAQTQDFGQSFASLSSYSRANGFSVRCIKD